MDSLTCDMMVAMLQKLSLSRQQRIYMIESGLLEWLINHLHDKCRIISLYRLEYATALLMNLSLHRLAQARASKISSLLMSTLLILLSIDHTSVSKITFDENICKRKKILSRKCNIYLLKIFVSFSHYRTSMEH